MESLHKIRRAEVRDIPRLLALLVQVDMVHHNARPDLFRGPATKYTAEELKEILCDDKRPIFVSTDGEDRVLGYAFCIVKQAENDSILTDIKTLYLDDLCVDEAFRRQRIGQELYDHCLSYAKEIGCYNLTLNVWADNPGAMRFYEKCGLVPQKIGLEKIL